MQKTMFQALADCPCCRVDGAVVEVIDSTSGQARVVESTCRLCGRREEEGKVIRSGKEFASPPEVVEALQRWAEREGEQDITVFAHANFGELSPEALGEAVVGGREVATSFQAVAWLFPGSVGGVKSADGLEGEDQAPDRERREAEGGGRRLSRAEIDSGRIAARALIAVMVGDGQIRVEERQFIDRCLEEHGYPPLDEADLKPWRPGDLARPDDPEALIESMAHLVYVDEERDGSEWRIVREFARAWGYPLARLDALEQQLEERYSSRMKRFVMSVRRLLIKEGR
jgi:uncharacterized tellurite resistance protein B-like protein